MIKQQASTDLKETESTDPGRTSRSLKTKNLIIRCDDFINIIPSRVLSGMEFLIARGWLDIAACTSMGSWLIDMNNGAITLR